MAAAWFARPDISAVPSHRLAPRLLPDQPVTIVALGTSLTLHAVWPDRLGLVLAKCGIRAKVVRMAKAGATSDWAAGTTEWLAGERPDLVVAEFSINDADIIDGVWPWTSRENIKNFANAVAAMDGGPRVLLVSTSPVSGVAQSLRRPFLASYQAQYQSLAAELELGYLNATALWKKENLGQILSDGLHPDPERDADLMLPALAQAIGSAFGKSCGIGTNG